MRSFIRLVVASLLPITAQAQLSNGCFTIGGPEWELARAVVQISDGGYAFAGATYSYSTGSFDENSYVVKTDANGVVQWNMGFGPADTELMYDLIQTTDGGYALAGVSSPGSMGLVKLDAAGAVQWSMQYDTSDPDAVDDLYAVVQAPDGGYLLAGSATEDMVAIKTDAAGVIEWSMTYDNNIFGYMEAYDAVVAIGGGYALCGWPTGSGGMQVLRLDDIGDVLWAKSYGEGNEFAHALAATPDSGFVVAGRTRSYGFSSMADQQDDGFVAKVDQDGALEWARAYGSDSLSEELLGVVPTTDGGYAMAGQAAVPPLGSGAPKMYVVKCDANGQRLWSQKLATNFLTGQAWDIIECTDGGLVVTGAVNAAGNVQCSLMKMEADGTICPTCGAQPYGSDSAAAFTPVDLTVTVFDNVATATPYTVDVFPGGTAVIGCSGTGVEEFASDLDALSISPNPASDACTVVLDRDANTAAIDLVDLQGNVIQRVAVNGRTRITVPLTGIADGIYLLRAIGSVRVEAERLVVAR